MPKARVVVMDIETKASTQAAVLAQIRVEQLEKTPANNVKKAIKDLWDTPAGEKDRIDAAIAKTAVNTLLAEPIVIGFARDDSDVEMFPIGDLSPDCYTLTNVADYIAAHIGPETLWVGHNLVAFDLMVLLSSFRRWDIPLPAVYPRLVNGRYPRWEGPVYDTMVAVGAPGGFISADALSVSLGLPSLKNKEWRGQPVTGALVGAMLEAKEYELITEYCAEDIRGTRDVFRKLTFGGTYGTGREVSDVVAAIEQILGGDEDQATKDHLILRSMENLRTLPWAVRDMLRKEAS